MYLELGSLCSVCEHRIGIGRVSRRQRVVHIGTRTPGELQEHVDESNEQTGGLGDRGRWREIEGEGGRWREREGDELTVEGY